MAAVDYKLIKNFFTKEELNILQKYCFNKLSNNPNYAIDVTAFGPSWYNDPLMISLLDLKLPIVEKESNLKLFPTYSYWRYYVYGGSLKKHSDRPSCEISVTACIKKYDTWPIVVEGTSFELEEGDAILYSGCDQEHWRPGIYTGNGLAQAFFHYVNQQGPYKHHAYDQFFKSTGKIACNTFLKIKSNERKNKNRKPIS